MTEIKFQSKLNKIGPHFIIRLPKEASAKLPARGQNMVRGEINGTSFETPLEPDGAGSHWFEPDKNMRESLGLSLGDILEIELEPTKEWPEPKVPEDFMKAIKADPSVHRLWKDVTPLARWEWIRWMRSTSNEQTRKRRIEVGCSKMRSGERRPCCWNRNLCTVPDVSKNGVLLEPSAVVK